MLKTWKKYQTVPYVNIARPTMETPEPARDWARIGKSTIFDLNLNANTESFDFIEDEAPTEEIKNYAPTLSQELRTVRGDKAFDALFEMMYNLPTGDEAHREVLLTFPAVQAPATGSDGPKLHAWLVDSSVVLTNFNTVNEKILFALNFAGTIVRGSVQAADGAPEFTPYADQNSWVSTADAAPPVTEEP